MKLFIYEHCPYCIRVRMLINLKNLPVEIVILPYNDEQTPIDMIGQKMLPILQKPDNSFLPESMDIIDFLDNFDNNPIIKPSNNNGAVTEAISMMLPSVYRIAMPRWTTIALKEFETDDSKRYFINHKTLAIGSFEEAISNTDKYQEVILSALATLNDNLDVALGDHYVQEEFTKNDIYLFPILLSLTSYRKFDWPDYAQGYLRFMSEKNRILPFTK